MTHRPPRTNVPLKCENEPGDEVDKEDTVDEFKLDEVVYKNGTIYIFKPMLLKYQLLS